MGMDLLQSIGYIVVLLLATIGTAVTVWCAWVGARTLGRRIQFARDFTPDTNIPNETLRQIT